MIFLKKRSITIFMAIAALMLGANLGMTQTEWEKCPGNPVLDLGASGTWDNYHVSVPTVLFDGAEYQMWYRGNDGSKGRIGYVTSTPPPQEPVIVVVPDILNFGNVAVGGFRERILNGMLPIEARWIWR